MSFSGSPPLGEDKSDGGLITRDGIRYVLDNSRVEACYVGSNEGPETAGIELESEHIGEILDQLTEDLQFKDWKLEEKPLEPNSYILKVTGAKVIDQIEPDRFADHNTTCRYVEIEARYEESGNLISALTGFYANKYPE